MTDFIEHIQKMTTERVKERHEAIEQICEQMLFQPGNRGVLVTDHLNDSGYSVELSYEVPFGEIHYRRK